MLMENGSPISVEDMAPGMVIAEDIFDCNGRFLLGKGVKITPNHLRVLKIWGVTEARIEGVTERDVHRATASRLNPALLQSAAQKMKIRFRHANVEHEAMRELFRLCAFRAAHQMTNGESPAGVSDEEFSSPSDGKRLELKQKPWPTACARELVHKDIKLPALPTIFFQLNDALNDPRSSAKDIATIIKNDTSLSAKLLKLANSPIYRYASKVETVSRAVTLIGTKEIGVLALGITVMTCFRGVSQDLIDMASFWKHSVACGIAARMMASFKRISNIERLFTAGLLHDIGRMVIYKYLPDEAEEALVQARFEDVPLYRTELQTFGLNHATMGGLFLKEWRFPVSIENSVRYHHSPMKSRDPLEPAIISVADIVVNALGLGSGGEICVLPLDPDAWKLLGFPKSIFSTLIKQVDRQVEETTRIFSDD